MSFLASQVIQVFINDELILNLHKQKIILLDSYICMLTGPE